MINIDEMIKILKEDDNFREIIDGDNYYYKYPHELSFTKVSYDSRDVDSKTLFFAKGLNFKREFLLGAVEAGLKFYVSERDYEVGIPVLMVSDIRKAMSLLCQAFYGYPQRDLKIMAFTGTKGKTTAAYFAKNILDATNGHKTALLSTMETTLDGINYFKSALSTPESLDLFRMMACARDNHMTHLVMEVSSQANKISRVYGLKYDVGIFLNISPDHVGPIEHPTYEDYFYCKRMLIKNSRFMVVNSDMDHFDLVRDQCADIPHAFYGSKSDNLIHDSEAFSFKTTGVFNENFDIKLIGHFNQENALAAALAAKELGADISAIKKGIAKTTVPGRMEILKQANGAHVYVDYAHNGVSLNNLLEVVETAQDGKVQLLLGAPGNKGESRRKDFADVLNKYTNIQVILTSDDPNFEDPSDICAEIGSFMTRSFETIIDREEAIQTALARTKGPGDAVIIAGKGADAYQIIGGKHAEYAGDRAVAEKYL
ncbi:UDP-N-acetylmuramoyl-L-alanyl-D-glutamate--L-lysine ligase [Streptococcaceae bacterium ESL0687]|nr:UDP-N-acetylmuramoyl-L-alanyl-D-glutamate--L-lysine ligase [Streptococcaceae bacterium ESL0687]